MTKKAIPTTVYSFDDYFDPRDEITLTAYGKQTLLYNRVVQLSMGITASNVALLNAVLIEVIERFFMTVMNSKIFTQHCAFPVHQGAHSTIV